MAFFLEFDFFYPPPWFGQIPNFFRFSLTVIRWGCGGGELLTNCLILHHGQLRLLGGTKNKLQKLGFLLTLTAFYWLIRFSTDFVLTFTSFFQLLLAFTAFYWLLLAFYTLLRLSTDIHWPQHCTEWWPDGVILIFLLSTDFFWLLHASYWLLLAFYSHLQAFYWLLLAFYWHLLVFYWQLLLKFGQFLAIWSRFSLTTDTKPKYYFIAEDTFKSKTKIPS